MNTSPEIDAAFDRASALGDQTKAADELVEQIGDLASALVVAEQAIAGMGDGIKSALGSDLVKRLCSVALDIYQARNAVHEAGRIAAVRADTIERHYHAALADARELEAARGESA